MNLEKRVRLLNNFLSIVIVLLLVIGGLSVFADTTTDGGGNGTDVDKVTDTGVYNGLTYTVYGNEKLVISGNGSLDALDEEGKVNLSLLPWNKYKNDITTLIIEKGITEIGEDVFKDYSFLTKISLGQDIVKIGKNAFKGCKKIKSILIPASVTEIGDGAFAECTDLDKVFYASSTDDWKKINIGSNNAYLTKVDEKNFHTTSSNKKFGIGDILNVPIGYVLKISYMLGRNYAVALLIFAIFMKIILFPFGIKQQKSMQKQAALKPKEMAIRNKYKGRNDKVTQQKMQQEIMEMQQREGVSMFGGCLPLLIQLPIIFVLFNVIRDPLKYLAGLSDGTINVIKQRASDLGLFTATNRNDGLDIVRVVRNNFDSFSDIKGLAGKIDSVSDLPNFTIFKGFDLGNKPELTSWLVLVPILVFVTMFLTSKLNRKLTYQPTQGTDAGKSMIIMDVMMPLMSVFFSFTFPAIIGVYWIYQNVVGTGQQLILKRLYPMPQFTEEDFKKAENELKGKTEKKKKKPSAESKYDGEEDYRSEDKPVVKRNPKSLHYIDFEDDEDTDKKAAQTKPASKELGKNKKGNPMIGAAEMKKYDKKEEKEETDGSEDEE